MKKSPLFFIISGLYFLNLTNCSSPPPYKQTKFLLNTLVEITVEGERESKAERAVELAFAEIKRIENLMSRHREGSEVYLINQQAFQKEIPISPELFSLIKTAQIYTKKTNGAFDITVTPLLLLWKKVKQRGKLPSTEEIKKALSLVGAEKIILGEKEHTIKLAQPGVQIDLGGIAKGYAVDKAIEVLKKEGISRALVNAGGDLYTLGHPLKRDHWRVGVQDPYNKTNILGIIKLKNMAVATSGNYERFFELGGRKYCHIVNPQTGYPVPGMLSVTIIAPTTLEADILATAVFVLGAQEGMNLIDSLPQIEGIIITPDPKDKKEMKFFFSTGVKNYLVLE